MSKRKAIVEALKHTKPLIIEDNSPTNAWLVPSIEACYLSEAWQSKGFERFLDLGCGLGRHSIYFAEKGFEVDAVDLSEYGVKHLKNWAEKERLNIKADVCDMLNLPFADNTIDCIIAYNNEVKKNL